ncbi:MAG: hypothetical protein NVS1B10_01390 [Candidatus Saccharimonadales bacterium]
MRQTRFEAYLVVKKGLSRRQTQVLNAVKRLQPCNYLTLCDDLNLGSHNVYPRIVELVKKDKIKEAYVKIGPTGNQMTYYRVATDDETADLG